MGVGTRRAVLGVMLCLLAPPAVAPSPFSPEYYCLVDLQQKPRYRAKVWRIVVDRKEGPRLRIKSASFYLFDRPSSRLVDAAALDVPQWTDERGRITLTAVDYDTKRHYVLTGSLAHYGPLAEREGFVTLRGSHREYRGTPGAGTLVTRKEFDLRGNPAVP